MVIASKERLDTSLNPSALEERQLHTIKLGARYEVSIDDLSHAGEGVGRVNGMAIFVEGALPGDKVVAEVMEVKKSFARGRVIEMMDPSPERVVPDCPVTGECGGCQLRSLDYAAQLEWKRNQVRQALGRIGGFQDIQVLPTLGMADPRYYRNKAQFHGKETAVFGFYEKGSNKVVPLPQEGCLLQKEPQNEIVRSVMRIAGELGVRLKGMLIRSSRANGEVMVVLVTRDMRLAKADELVRRIREALPLVVSIYHSVNPRDYGAFLGREVRLVSGKAELEDRVGRFRFRISPQSFFQVNLFQTEVLYRKALEYAGLTGKETVFDLYCGIGTISLFLAERARRVIGVEEVKPAVEDARANAELNGVSNAEFVAGRVEKVLPELVAKGVRPDVVVLDPPRAGAAPEVLEAIAATGVGRVVYVSCNPATLARDLRLLAERGFELQEVQPVDMFPHTSHVETVVLMLRVKE